MGSISISTPLLRADSIPNELRFSPRLKRNQDMDFMFRYFLGIEGWVYTPGFWFQYNQHRATQISDSYHLGMQYAELFDSVYDYWQRNKGWIPNANRWMVGEFASGIALSLYCRGRISKANKAALFAVTPPFSALQFISRSWDFARFHLTRVGRRVWKKGGIQ
ncbi:unnamed protein product [marine sediment metagenome]|uniref:Uncharacterized protein n=1 Tax=marine sediment metagenome TaxID=412755 RepID=X0X1E4_9ZZZZ